MYLLKTEDGQGWAEHPLRIIQVIHWDGQANGKARRITFSQMMNTSTAIVRMDGSFLSVMKAVLNYTGVFELQYGVSFCTGPYQGYR